MPKPNVPTVTVTGITEDQAQAIANALMGNGFKYDVDFEMLYGAHWVLSGVEITNFTDRPAGLTALVVVQTVLTMESTAAGYLAELERRWRARTPSTRIDEVLPETRVGRSEMRAWFKEQYGTEVTLDHELNIQPAVTELFKRLRKEFPNERWS